jgi:hypothetical protein
MQRELLRMIDERLRRSCGNPGDLLKLLVEAYASPHTLEALPGLRAAIGQSTGREMREREQALLDFLRTLPADFDVIDAVVPAQAETPFRLRNRRS